MKKISAVIGMSLFFCAPFFSMAQSDSVLLQRKNIIKINPLIALPFVFEYERMLTSHLSINTRYTYFDPNVDVDGLLQIRGRSGLYGHMFMPECRYYLWNKPNSLFPLLGYTHRGGPYIGFYLGAKYLNHNFTDNLAKDTNAWKHPLDSINFSYTARSTEYTGGISLGYHYIGRHGFTFDVFMRIGYRNVSIARNFLTPNLNDNMLKEKFPSSYQSGRDAILGIRIGYNFNLGEVKRNLIDPPFESKKKNVLKLSAAILIGDFSASYEGFIAKRFSLNLSAGYFYNYLGKVPATDVDGSISRETSRYKVGYHVTPSLRYYIPVSAEQFPGGLYLEPLCRYRSFTYYFMDKDTIPGNIKYDYKQTVSQFGLGLSLGRQSWINKQLYLDVYAGAVYNTMNLKNERQYQNALADDMGLGEKFFNVKTFSDYYMIGGVRVGMAF